MGQFLNICIVSYARLDVDLSYQDAIEFSRDNAPKSKALSINFRRVSTDEWIVVKTGSK